MIIIAAHFCREFTVVVVAYCFIV